MDRTSRICPITWLFGHRRQIVAFGESEMRTISPIYARRNNTLSVESVVRVMVVVGEPAGRRRSGMGDRQGREALEVGGIG